MGLKNVCVVGASGAVGVEMVKVLERRNFPVASLGLFSSSRSAGKFLKFRGEDIELLELREDSFKGYDIALFSAGSSRSLSYARYALDAGCVVIDNSSAFRMDKTVPLVIPEINGDSVRLHKGIVSNPNCSTIILLMGVYPIHCLSPIRRLICSTYQSASGAGALAMDELLEQSSSILSGGDVVSKVFPHQIGFNLFSHDSEIGSDGYNVEEVKMVEETHKILGDDGIRVGVTCVRVPIVRTHSESISLELSSELSLDEIRGAILGFSGLRLVDDRGANHFPMPVEASGRDEVLVGRLRRDLSCENGVSLFVVGDQLLKGAALNAVQIAELL